MGKPKAVPVVAAVSNDLFADLDDIPSPTNNATIVVQDNDADLDLLESLAGGIGSW